MLVADFPIQSNMNPIVKIRSPTNQFIIETKAAMPRTANNAFFHLIAFILNTPNNSTYHTRKIEHHWKSIFLWDGKDTNIHLLLPTLCASRL